MVMNDTPIPEYWTMTLHYHTNRLVFVINANFIEVQDIWELVANKEIHLKLASCDKASLIQKS